MSDIRFSSFPRTEPPPHFVEELVEVFRRNEPSISTKELEKGLTSNEVLGQLREQLTDLGFEVERSQKAKDKVRRPVFFGENGKPELQYEVDAFHPEWRCGLEIEAGRALMGNAIYRDLIQALVMVNVEHLVVAVRLLERCSSKCPPLVLGRDKPNLFKNEIFVHDREDTWP